MPMQVSGQQAAQKQCVGIDVSTISGQQAAQKSRELYVDVPVAMPSDIATGTSRNNCLLVWAVPRPE
jgi:hypothetical protein